MDRVEEVDTDTVARAVRRRINEEDGSIVWRRGAGAGTGTGAGGGAGTGAGGGAGTGAGAGTGTGAGGGAGGGAGTGAGAGTGTGAGGGAGTGAGAGTGTGAGGGAGGGAGAGAGAGTGTGAGRCRCGWGGPCSPEPPPGSQPLSPYSPYLVSGFFLPRQKSKRKTKKQTNIESADLDGNAIRFIICPNSWLNYHLGAFFV